MGAADRLPMEEVLLQASGNPVEGIILGGV